MVRVRLFIQIKYGVVTALLIGIGLIYRLRRPVAKGIDTVRSYGFKSLAHVDDAASAAEMRQRCKPQ